MLFLNTADQKSEGSANIFAPLLAGKLDRIQNEKYYPKSYRDKLAVAERAISSVGYGNYDPLAENCQHLITKYLLNNPYSEDALRKVIIAPLMSILLRDSTEIGRAHV